jgi:hypothetical protein
MSSGSSTSTDSWASGRQVSRNDFGVRPNGLLGLMDNALVVCDRVNITLKIEAVLNSGKRQDLQIEHRPPGAGSARGGVG